MQASPQDALAESDAVAQSAAGGLESIRRRALWLLVAFLVALSFFALRNLIDKVSGLENAGIVRQWTTTSTQVSVVIHELQKERGLSSGFIASAGRSFGEQLRLQRQFTDDALQRLNMQAGLEAEPEARPAAPPFAELVAATRALRLPVDQLRFSRDFVVDRYTALIEGLFDSQLESFGSGFESATFRQQMAFLAFMQAKEKMGQERALVAAMLSDRNFSAGRMASYYRIKAMEEAHLTDFRRLAGRPALAAYQAIVDQSYSLSAEKMRRKVVAFSLADLTRSDAGEPPDSEALPALPVPEAWFALSSQKIDAMKQLEDSLNRAVSDSTEQLESRARLELAISGLLALVSFGLAWTFVRQIQHGRREAEHQLGLADAVFRNSSEAILVTDPQQQIVEINPAFTRITGYTREDAIGQTPRILKSGRHDPNFYADIWANLINFDSWEGEIWNRRKNGEIYPALLSIVAVRNSQGVVTNYTGLVVELSQHKKIEALLQQSRTFDALTGLPNRQSWLSALDQMVVAARREQGRFTVLELDLDRFKLVNDSFGHPVGDRVLVEVAERIKRILRKQDIAARPTGDCFSILLPDIAEPQEVGAICEKLLAAFASPFEIERNLLQITCSIGVAQYPADGENASTLMMSAESALYSAQGEGRNLYKYYSSDMNVLGAQILKLERLLRQALENGEFSVVYQPQVSAADGRLVGVEALLRWTSPELGNVSPVQFIPIAEETGLIVPIGEWVMRAACREAQGWRTALGVEVPVAVNLSARQFRRNDLLSSVQTVLDQTGLASHLLELEITEGLLIVDPASAADILRGLHAMGIRIALDDFGTGYSSLAYLKTFTLDRLKIDRAFVRDLPENLSDQAIARTVIALGLNLQLEVLAVGVEPAAQGEFLAAAGCQVFQGYFYGRPISGEDLARRIASGELSVRR